MRKSENSAPRARESEWHVLQRCLALLRCILRGEATKSALLEIERAEADAIQDHDGVAFEKRLENDLHRLRVAPLNNRIVFDREHKSYSALEIDPPLIDLPPEAVKGLAFLQSAFIQDTPMYAEVRALANLVMQAIPAERRDEVTKLRGVLEIDLQRKDFDEISALIVEQIERAITNHQRLELHYAAASREDREVVIHTVEPIRRFFDTVRKHFYLEAYCLETRSSKGHFAWQEVRNYRLGRLVKVNILPKRFIPNAHRRRKIDLIYRLAPDCIIEE